MARLFSSGFEQNSITGSVEWTANSGTPVIQSSTVRSGTYALQINSLVSATNKYLSYQYLSAEGTSNLYYRFYFRADTLPTAQNRIAAWNDTGSNPANSPSAYMTIDNSGVLRLFDEDGQITGTTTLSTGTWYCIEVHINTTPAGGSQTVEARVDGAATFASSSSRNIASTNQPFHFYVGGNMGGESQTTGNWFFDDIAINDTTGSFQTSWPGEGHIIHLLPDAAGDVNTFATQTGGTAGSANNFTRIDELPPDDATTFNGSSTVNQEDLFNLPASGLESTDVVTLVSVGGRFRNSTADTSAAVRFEIEKTSGGTITQSSSIVPNSTTWVTNAIAAPRTYPITAYQNPDAANWTSSTVDSMQIGYKLQTAPAVGGRRIDVSQVWALVEYIDYSPSVSDTVTVTDSIMRYTDSVFVSESVQVEIAGGTTDKDISKSENVTVTESVQVLIPELLINKSENVTVTESVQRHVENRIAVSDSATVSESLQRMAENRINVSDNVTVTESVQRHVENNRAVSDTVTVTESIKLEIVSSINKSENVTVSESVKLENVKTISVSDSVTVTEAVQRHVENRIAVSDTATVTDTPTVLIPQLFINVSDNVSVSESVSASILVAGNLSISVNDNVTVTEAIQRAVESFINKSESVTVTESRKLEVQSDISKSDTVTVTESVSVRVSDPQINVSDTVSVTDQSTVGIEGVVSARRTMTLLGVG